MLLLSSLWAGGAAMASYCAVMSTQSQHVMLCGTGSGDSSGAVVTYAQLGLPEPETDLPSAEQCDCELRHVQAAPVDGGAVVFTPVRYAQTARLSLSPDANILRAIRAVYLSRGPPLRA